MTHIDNLSAESRERILTLVKDIEMISDELKDLKAAGDELREKLVAEMIEFELDYIDNGTAEVKYIPPKIQQKLDSKKLESDHPDLYQQYLIESEMKGHIRVTKLK
jgi:Phage-related protein, predicted endonuclease